MSTFCRHPFVCQDGAWFRCASCGLLVRPAESQRPCGCPADPVVFGHMCGEGP